VPHSVTGCVFFACRPTSVLESKDTARYRETAWLIKRHAVSVLPSVPSLRALRAFGRRAENTKAMIGFGDPIFDPTERARALAQRSATKTRVAFVKRSYRETRPEEARGGASIAAGDGRRA